MAERRSNGLAISVVIPSYGRDAILVETLETVIPQCVGGDEIIVVDQTPRHDPDTGSALARLHAERIIRWVRKSKPSICEAMNLGALLARGDLLVFLDDDARPQSGFLAAYRGYFSGPDAPHAACGQILQPWDHGPSDEPGGDPECFNFASRLPGEIVGVMAGNFAVRRKVFLDIGGMDETFQGGAYRCDAEVGYRLLACTGQRTRFFPAAVVHHLHAAGGTRAHGHKDSWAAIESAVGDYYFAFRCLPLGKAVRHTLSRAIRAAFNRNTVSKPWLIGSVAAREIVAMGHALKRARVMPRRGVRAISDYTDIVAGGEARGQ